MNVISPTIVDVFVEKVLDKISSDFIPEIVPVISEDYAKPQNCFINVEEKVRRDGGKVHYGWAIYKSDILCEAERHAVWEKEDGELIDITPKPPYNFHQIMFVSDNDNFVFAGQFIDNIRVNTTNNSVVDDFILIAEILELLYSFATRINDEQIVVEGDLAEWVAQYQNLKNRYIAYLSTGNRSQSKCFCGGDKSYKNCHGANLKRHIATNRAIIKAKFEK